MKKCHVLFNIALFAVVCAIYFAACGKLDKANEAEKQIEYVYAVDHTNYVYMICDVAYPPIETNDGTELDVELPNGELHAFMVEDVPDGVSEVVIKTSDIDDYATYEIVGMR